jgi:hypothetical protein
LREEVAKPYPGNLIIWKDDKKPVATSKAITLPDKGRYWVLGFDDKYMQAMPVLL